MQVYVDDMLDSESESLAAVHYKNRYIPSNQCYDCHTSYGMFGTVEAKMGRLSGGFSVAPEVQAGGPLVVLYSTNLAEIEAGISEAGGQIVRAIFEFPGGRRFHFTDPSGNELAVWSDQ